ncbi:hypothetical protein FRB99_009019, partial [Tulasnella sp. 403]
MADFQPRLCFFYGTLMLPHILRQVLRMDDLPSLTNARLRGYKMKMWGPYPTLLPLESDEASGDVEVPPIRGRVYLVTQSAHIRSLERYETENYRLVECELEVEEQVSEGASEYHWVKRRGWTFIWNSYEDELED